MRGLLPVEADAYGGTAYAANTVVSEFDGNRPTAAGPITLESYVDGQCDPADESTTPEYRAWVARQVAKRAQS